MFIIACPNCGNQEVEEVEYRYFECPCGEDFTMDRANYEEV